MLLNFKAGGWSRFGEFDENTNSTNIKSMISMCADPKIKDLKYQNQSIDLPNYDAKLLKFTAVYSKDQKLSDDMFNAMLSYQNWMAFGIDNSYDDVFITGKCATLEAEFLLDYGAFAYGIDSIKGNKLCGEWLYKLNSGQNYEEKIIFSRNLIADEYVSNLKNDRNIKRFASLHNCNDQTLCLGFDIKEEFGDDFTYPYHVPKRWYKFDIKEIQIEWINQFLRNMGIVAKFVPYNDCAKNIPEDVSLCNVIAVGGFLQGKQYLRIQKDDYETCIYELITMSNTTDEEIHDIWDVIALYINMNNEPNKICVFNNFCKNLSDCVQTQVIEYLIRKAPANWQIIMFNPPVWFMDILRPDGVWFIKDTKDGAITYALSTFKETHNRKSDNYLVGRYT